MTPVVSGPRTKINKTPSATETGFCVPGKMLLTWRDRARDPDSRSDSKAYAQWGAVGLTWLHVYPWINFTFAEIYVPNHRFLFLSDTAAFLSA